MNEPDSEKQALTSWELAKLRVEANFASTLSQSFTPAEKVKAVTDYLVALLDTVGSSALDGVNSVDDVAHYVEHIEAGKHALMALGKGLFANAGHSLDTLMNGLDLRLLGQTTHWKAEALARVINMQQSTPIKNTPPQSCSESLVQASTAEPCKPLDHEKPGTSPARKSLQPINHVSRIPPPPKHIAGIEIPQSRFCSGHPAKVPKPIRKRGRPPAISIDGERSASFARKEWCAMSLHLIAVCQCQSLNAPKLARTLTKRRWTS
jgi:hypothetical protein